MGPPSGRYGAVFAILELDEQLLIEEPPPDRDHLAGKIAAHLVIGAVDADSGVAGDPALLGFARERAEPLPRAHLAEPRLGKVAHPVPRSGCAARDDAAARCSARCSGPARHWPPPRSAACGSGTASRVPPSPSGTAARPCLSSAPSDGGRPRPAGWWVITWDAQPLHHGGETRRSSRSGRCRSKGNPEFPGSRVCRHPSAPSRRTGNAGRSRHPRRRRSGIPARRRPLRSSTTLNSMGTGRPLRSGSIQAGCGISFKSDGLTSNCHIWFRKPAPRSARPPVPASCGHGHNPSI